MVIVFIVCCIILSVYFQLFKGTNFGFTAGANDGGPGKFNSDVSSYDYDAPMDEAGDPTDKYFAIRDIIAQVMILCFIIFRQ